MRSRLNLLPLLALLVAGCSDLPTEVVDAVGLHATELGLRADVAPYSRAALFREAISQVIDAEGPRVLWQRTGALRRHAAAARAAQTRSDTAAHIAAERQHRTAQLTFIAATLGDARIDDVSREVQTALDDARARIAAARAEGQDVTRAASLIEDAAVSLAHAGAGPVGVLAAAVDAADALTRSDQLLLALNRLPSLDDLFAAAIADVRRAAGPQAARALLAEHQTLVREAQSALANGGRVRAHDRLQDVRARQVQIVVQHIGGTGVARHVAGVLAAERAIAGNERERRRVVARDYLQQAVDALQREQLERALDRAVIAAEIVNALTAEQR